MSGQNHPGVIPSFFLFAAVLLFATGASATTVPFEELPYGTSLDSQDAAPGAVSSAESSDGSEAGNPTIRKSGGAVGVGAILSSYRSAARHSQPDFGVPVPSASVGRQPFVAGNSASGLPLFNAANSRSSATPMGVTARGSSGNHNGHTPLDASNSLAVTSPGEDVPDARFWGDPGEAPGGGNVVIPDNVSFAAAPVPEPSALLVFSLGALLVGSAPRRRQR